MMNYVGSVSILDRGDAPARAIIDKNARTLAQRIADETKDELDKVMNRVENIYVSYEQSTQDMFATSQANVEYLEDLKELEAILTDQIKKKKYQQQVTVFIVGFENMSSRRLKLIQQVNEFFMDATRPEEDEPFPTSPDIDMDEVAVSIEESLDTAEKLADRLGELNTEMCDWLTNYAINKASTKALTNLDQKGKKKLEKALSQAKDDISSLSEKLLKVQGEMEEKDEKVQQLIKQLEAKGQDVQKFRTAAEIAKKSIQDLETANGRANEDIKARDKTIKDLKSKLSMLELEVGQSEYMSKMSTERQVENKMELQRRLEDLQNQVDNQKSIVSDAQRDWQKLHDQQVLALTNAHKEEMAEMQAAFEEELKKSKDEIEFTRVQLQEAEKNAQLAAEEADKIRQNLIELQLRGSSSESKRPVEESEDEVQESRPSTKGSKQSSAPKQKSTTPAKSPVKPAVTVQQKSPTKPPKEVSESSVQDEGGDHLSAHVETRQSKRSRSTLEPVQEVAGTPEFDNEFDLKDDQSWSSVPGDQLAGRFKQYRKLSQKKVEDLEEQLNIVMAKTQRKVATLKSQFQEHKSKWESERRVLIEQVEQAQKLQTEAEKEADNAMSQLEEFINEQERLEEEEEEKRNEISKGIVSRPITRRASPEKRKASPTEEDRQTPEPEPETVAAEGSEQELKRLMQQTDDAKSQRQRSESIYSSASIDQDIAPWLMAGKSKSRADSSTSASDVDEVEDVKRKSTSKSSFRTKSERLHSEMSRMIDPDEADEEETENEIRERSHFDAIDTDDSRLTRSQKSLKSKSQKSLSRGETLETSEIDEVGIERSRSHSQKKLSRGGTQGSRRSSRVGSVREDIPLIEADDDDEDEENVERSRSTSRRRGSTQRGETVDSYRSSRKGSRKGDGENIQIESSRSISSKKMSRGETLGSHRSSKREPSDHHEKSQLSHRSSRRSRSGSHHDNQTLARDPTESRSRRDNQSLPREEATRVSSFYDGSLSRHVTQEEEELMDMLSHEDDHYSDGFEDDEKNRLFDDNMASRIRSEPVGMDTDQEKLGIRNLGSAPGHLNAQEMARITSGAMSAPPAVEPEGESPKEESTVGKEFVRKLPESVGGVRSPRPMKVGKSIKSHPHKGMTDAEDAIEELSEGGSRTKSKSRESAGSQREAWYTPRTTPALRPSPSGDRSPIPPLPPSQASAVSNVKGMMEEDNLSGMQLRTLDSLRSALQKVNEERNLTDVQLERTLTIISLASQLTEESLQLGVLPDSLFDQFAEINSHAMSDLSHGEDQFEFDDSSMSMPPVEFLRPFTRESLRREPPTVMTFLQELSQSSLKSLPPLHGYLTSSQSQRNVSRQRSGFSTAGFGKMPSAPLTKPRHDLENERSFATLATRGSTGDMALSKQSTRSVMDRKRAEMMSSLRGMPGGEDTELDIIMMESEVYLTNGIPVRDQQIQTQTDPEITGEPTEEDIQRMSSHSRASLRSQFRNRLEESRAAIEDRRAKSPAISVPSQRSLEEDQLIEEDDDDFPMPDVKEETVDVGTSPPPIPRGQSTSMSRRSAALADHPVVREYLRAYEGIMDFKEGLSKVMMDRELLQAGEILHDIDMLKFDRESKVKPQLEKMTANVYQVLEEIMNVLGSMLYSEREPVVSSLTGMVVSRDGTKTTLPAREKSADSGRGQTMTRASNQSISTRLMGSDHEEKHALRDLQTQYERLEQQLNDETRKHEEQLRHNTVVMMEMQDTINELQRELSALGRSSSRMRPGSEMSQQQQPPESAIMFTRLDSERNAKIMKRAVNDEKLDVDRYKDAVTKMDAYVSLPAQRLGHLVRKYVHHCRMKEIEENVKKSRSLNENVFEILDKMEDLQNQRAKRWADRMDDMGNERLRLASLLMDTLDSIEQESGIFLIKPMYSYRGRYSMGALVHQGEVKERFGGKLTRPSKPQRNISPSREVSSYAPAPTPASNIRGLVRPQAFVQQLDTQKQFIRMEPLRPLEGDDTGLMGSQALAMSGATQRQTWNLSSSQVRGENADFHSNLMNTPRILELDINRMLIGQNNISTKMMIPGFSEDRLVNASQNNLRSYVTVNRPTAQPTGAPQRPRSYSGIKDAPPTSPVTRSATSTSAGNKRVRMLDSAEVSRPSIPSTPPLPPISARDGESTDRDDGEPPRSPPGSSLRQSPPPPHIQEIISPIK